MLTMLVFEIKEGKNTQNVKNINHRGVATPPPPPNDFLAPPFCPSSKQFIRERLKATQAFCRYRKMYGL